MSACTIEFPVSIGDIVNVKISSLPADKLNMSKYEDMECLPGEVVSVRKNRNGRYIKIVIRAYWFEQRFDFETGDDSGYYEFDKYFTFPVSVVGKCIFVEGKGGQE